MFKYFPKYIEKNKQTSLTFCEILVYPTLPRSEMCFISYTSILSKHMPMLWNTI